jgi:LDH2 family malate/lactate/ureidoglycolate dehydrogenase
VLEGARVSRIRSAARRVAESVRHAGPLWTASLALDRVAPFGVLGLWPDRVVAADALAAQVAAILGAWGMSAEHVAITVPHLMWADLHGVDSHGTGMLLHYHRARRAGTLTMTPVVAAVREDEVTALVDGGGGLGHVPGDVAMRLAIAKCRAHGMGAVAVRNSGHFGAAGAYTALATAEGYVGIATTTTQEPAVVPTFGAAAMLGTNPIALGAPAARNPPFMLDMATSTASLGKLTTAWRKGREVPEGWALDPAGRPVTSGRLAARHRRLTPLGATPELGSHKGYGLATAVAILSSVLPGAPRPDATSRVGHFVLALDPARFREGGSFPADLDVLLDALRACPPSDPSRPVRVAGDPEHAACVDRSRTGIPLTRSLLEDLRTVARESDVRFTLDR